MTKLFWIILTAVCITAYGNSQDKRFLENGFFKLTLDNQGKLTELLEKETGKNLLIHGYSKSLLTVQSGGVNYPITSWKREGEILKLKFK